MKNSEQSIKEALVELLRLYDWRNELGRIERDLNHDKKQMKTWLNQYGREKKAAWEVARQLVAARTLTASPDPQIIPDVAVVRPTGQINPVVAVPVFSVMGDS